MDGARLQPDDEPERLASHAMHWVRTVGARETRDPRDGELHQLVGRLPDHFDLESWDEQCAEDPNDAAGCDDDDDWPIDDRSLRYFRVDAPPVVDDEGREVWLYEYRPTAT